MKLNKFELEKILQCISCGGNIKNLKCEKCGKRISKKDETYLYENFFTKEMVVEVKSYSEQTKQNKTNIINKVEKRMERSTTKGFIDFFKYLKKNKLINKKMKILELGGGYGWLSEYVSREVPFCVITDIVKDCLDYNNSCFKFVLPSQDIDKVFKPKSFDIIWVNSSLHHNKDLNSIYSAVSKVLKDNGLFIVTGELIFGFFEQGEKNLKEVNEMGLGDQPYKLRDYLKPSKKYFSKELLLPFSLSYLLNNPDFIETPHKRYLCHILKILKINKLSRTKFLKIIYPLIVRLIGAPIDIIFKKK